MNKGYIRLVMGMVFVGFVGVGILLEARGVYGLGGYYREPYVRVYGEGVYVYDRKLSIITVYSRSDMSKVTEFGRKGKGVGEFMEIDGVTVDDANIYVSGIGRVCIFTKGGKLLKEIRGGSLGGSFVWCGGNYVGNVYGTVGQRDKVSMVVFGLFDANLERIRNIREVPGYECNDFKNGREQVLLIRGAISAWVYNEKVFIGEPYPGFLISVYDRNGKKLYEIKREGGRGRVFSQADREKKLDRLRKSMGEAGWKRGKMIYDYCFPEYYPAFENFSVNNDIIYVIDFVRGEKRIVEMLDLVGNFLGKVAIDDLGNQTSVYYRRYCIDDGKFYYLEDNKEAEQWELHEVDLVAALVNSDEGRWR